ncbi:hypothetical protein AALB47_20055 [Lachnospiraceae bacterium 54-11]
MSEEDCSALVGTRFEYFKDYAIYDDQHRLDSPNISKALKPQMIFYPSTRVPVWKRWEFPKILFR